MTVGPPVIPSHFFTMAYTTLEKVKKRARKALDPSSSPGLLDPIITDGITYAEARIDSVLSVRYSVPFDDQSVPAAVEEIASDLAAAFALVEVYSGGGDNEPTLLADKLNERGEKWLAELAGGATKIPNGAGEVCSDPTKPRIVTNKKASDAAIANFDLVNRPGGSSVPFAPYRRRR